MSDADSESEFEVKEIENAIKRRKLSILTSVRKLRK